MSKYSAKLTFDVGNECMCIALEFCLFVLNQCYSTILLKKAGK